MKKQKAFTLVEVLIVSIAITIGLFSIVKAIDMAKLTLHKILQNTIANHIAKEGIELVYRQRNTNLLNGSGRLNIQSGGVLGADQKENMRNTGYYHIDKNNNFIKCTDTNTSSENKTGCDIIIQDRYHICLQNGMWVACPTDTEIDESTFGHYYRIIEAKGVYNMDSNTTGGVEITDFSDISNYKALEFRFCSKVVRVGGKDGETQLCSTMTNFSDL